MVVCEYDMTMMIVNSNNDNSTMHSNMHSDDNDDYMIMMTK